MDNNGKEKNPVEIFKLFDKWAESLPKEGQQLHNGTSFSKIGSEIKQHRSSMENREIVDNNATSDLITQDQETAAVKPEVVRNTENEDLKPNFLFELKHDKAYGSTEEDTSSFECVYDFCLALEKFCKSKSTTENRLHIDEDWKKLLFTCSSHNPERIMWIHLTFQTSNRLKLTWKQVVRRLMAKFDDPKRNLSLEAALSKFKFLPELESIYAVNSEFARYADELGDDTKRIVELYMNGMPCTIKKVLESTIAYDESTHFRYSLLDIQQRAAVFLAANEGDLIFYSKSAHLAIALEYEKVDTKNCEFHLLADHSSIECPDYTVLRFPYMDFSPLNFNSKFSTTTTPSPETMEGITSEADTRLNQSAVQLKPKIDAQQPIHDTAVPKSKVLSTAVDTGQTKNSMTAQKPSVPAASATITGQVKNAVVHQSPSLLSASATIGEQVKNPVVQQSPSVLSASALVGHQVIQQEHPTPVNPATTSKPQISNVALIQDHAKKEKGPQAEAKLDSKKENLKNAKSSTNNLTPSSVAQNVITRAPTVSQIEVTKSLTSPQNPVDDTAKASATTLKTAPSQKSTEAAFTWRSVDGLSQPVSTVELKSLTSEIPTEPAADRKKAGTQHLHVQRKNTAAPVQMQLPKAPKPAAIKINVPSNTGQANTQAAYQAAYQPPAATYQPPAATYQPPAATYQPPAAAYYTSGSPAIKKTKHDSSSSSHRSRSRSHSPPYRSRRRSRSISRSRSPDRHYRRSQSPPRRRRRLTSISPSHGSESPERGCYIHGKGASHSTKDCRQAQLVIQPRKLNLDHQNLPPHAAVRTNKKGSRPGGEPNICIFCGLTFKPGHLGYCTKVLPKQKPKRH